MKHFIFLLSDLQSFLVSFVVVQFACNFIFLVFSTHRLVLDSDSVDFAAVDKPVILVVTNLAFSSCFQFFPGLFFDHSCVGIHVLSLQSDFFELLGKSFIFNSFIILLFIDLVIGFYESLFSYLPFLLIKSLLVFQFLLSFEVIPSFSSFSSVLNL